MLDTTDYEPVKTDPRRSCLDKRGYWTMTDARRVADIREAAGAPPLRIYKCVRCLRYHLTKLMAPPSTDGSTP